MVKNKEKNHIIFQMLSMNIDIFRLENKEGTYR